MRIKENIWIGVALFHLVLVGLGAVRLTPHPEETLGKILSVYGWLSGSSGVYNFFAPGVGQGIRVEFDLIEPKDNKKLTVALEGKTNREAELRTANIIEFMMQTVDDEVLRRILSASWAAKVLSRYPDKTAVTVRVETLDIPTMSEYRRGIRFDWAPLYEAKFSRPFLTSK